MSPLSFSSSLLRILLGQRIIRDGIQYPPERLYIHRQTALSWLSLYLVSVGMPMMRHKKVGFRVRQT